MRDFSNTQSTQRYFLWSVSSQQWYTIFYCSVVVERIERSLFHVGSSLQILDHLFFKDNDTGIAISGVGKLADYLGYSYVVPSEANTTRFFGQRWVISLPRCGFTILNELVADKKAWIKSRIRTLDLDWITSLYYSYIEFYICHFSERELNLCSSRVRSTKQKTFFFLRGNSSLNFLTIYWNKVSYNIISIV